MSSSASSKESRRTLLLLSVATGLLLALSFPPVPTGLSAFIAFIPLLYVLEKTDRAWRVFRFGWLSFFVFHLGTTYWISGWTGDDPWLMVAGLAVNILHPLPFTLPLLAWHFVRKRRGRTVALFCLPFLWVGFEFVFHLPELSFPWLLMGNSQTYNISGMQIASITGVFGLSFWVLAINAFLFHLFRRRQEKGRMPWRSRAIPLLLLTIVLPHAYTALFVSMNIPADRWVRVAILQPDVDPYDKWGSGMSTIMIMDTLLASYDSVSDSADPDLVLLPETAITFRILQPSYRPEWDYFTSRIDSAGTPVLSGFPDLVWYFKPPFPEGSKRVPDSEYRYDNFNSALLVHPGRPEVQKYHKSRLTPMSERIPYMDSLPFLEDALNWGVGISSWGLGNDTTVFRLHTDSGSVPFWTMICYETLFPSFVSGFVQRGAEFLTVITNDGWFGNTSGPYQLKQFAALRAVENHRAIARCANNGVSCLIDAHGRVSGETRLYTRTTAVYDVPVFSDVTFYTRHGDWFAELVSGCALFLLVLFSLSKRKTP